MNQESIPGLSEFLNLEEIREKGYYWFRPTRKAEWKIVKVSNLTAKAKLHGEYSGPIPSPDNKLMAAGVSSMEITREVSLVFESWNLLGDPFGKVLQLSTKRAAALKQRVQETLWKENWREAMEKLKLSSFLRGETSKWKANFDWFIRPDSVMMIMEGKYDNQTAVIRSARAGEEPPE